MSSKGVHLRNLEGLIKAGQDELRAFAEGRTSFIGYITNLREHIEHSLADIGEPAQEELRELVSMDLSVSAELAAWYAKGVHNDFQVKEGDPADFRRAQAEYDRTMPPKIQRMIDLLERVRAKLLGIGVGTPQATVQPSAAQAEPAVQHSESAQPEPSKPATPSETSEPTVRADSAQPAPTATTRTSVSNHALVRPFATPEACTWAEIHIRFTSDFQVEISTRDRKEVRNYADMGFEDRRGRRSRKPDGNWIVLRRFAECDGAIQSTQEASDWRRLEKRVQRINARLRALFGFSDNGIFYDRPKKAYRTLFRITPPPDFEHTAGEE